jgi:hypothetical protein
MLTDDDIETAAKPFVDLFDEIAFALNGRENVPEKITNLIDSIWDSYYASINGGDRKDLS